MRTYANDADVISKLSPEQYRNLTSRRLNRLLGPGVLLPMILFGYSAAVQADYDAAGVYEMRCASCHGAAGQGTVAPPLGPALKGNAFVVNGPAPVIAAVIRGGRSGRQRSYDAAYPNMPAFSPISVSDVEALVRYLKGDLQK